MCGFGEEKTTGTTTQKVPEYLKAAGKTNLSAAEGLRDQGYTEYTGPRVADLTDSQTSAYGTIDNLAGSLNPYSGTSAGVFNDATKSNISAPRIIDNVPGAAGAAGGAGSTQDYMDPYLQQVLAPILRDLDMKTNSNQKGLDARAAMSGAFGDARTGIEAAENTRLGGLARTDAIGKTTSDAFNTAMGLKNTDINRLLDIDKTNAGRQMEGAKALTDLDKYDTGRSADLARMQATAGENERQIEQAKLDKQYEEFSKKTGYPIEMIKLINQTMAATPYDKVTTTTAPDNSGFGVLGSLAGTALSAALAPVTGGLSLAAIPAMGAGAAGAAG